MMKSHVLLFCNHEPRIIKKIGVVFGRIHEITLCRICSTDPDLENFQEEVIQK